jgi:hypothetical protein
VEDIEATGGITGALKRRIPGKRMNMTGEKLTNLGINLP